MIYTVTVDFFDIDAASADQAKAAMAEMLLTVGLTRHEITNVREG